MGNSQEMGRVCLECGILDLGFRVGEGYHKGDVNKKILGLRDNEASTRLENQLETGLI